MKNAALRDEINKRFTLNWLIQGASQHAGMTFHHLLRDELNAIDPELLGLYDQVALLELLQYWEADYVTTFGRPAEFWPRAATDPDHPFFGHALLAKQGGRLARVARRRALQRCDEKGFSALRTEFTPHAIFVLRRLFKLEAPHRPRLAGLAKQAASAIWGIPQDRLDAELTTRIEPPATIRHFGTEGERSSKAIVSYSYIAPRDGTLVVVARGINWQLLTKELVKGAAELVCLNGLNQLDDDLYRRVIETTDVLNFEPWMLQSGGELWRRFLAVAPDGAPPARILMRLARLPARALESIIAGVIERPAWARARLLKLMDGPAN